MPMWIDWTSPPIPDRGRIDARTTAELRSSVLSLPTEERAALAHDLTARADKITQAILAKAFRGELVPTEAELARQEGRDYEPASALLARIRATLAAQANSDEKPTRRPRASASDAAAKARSRISRRRTTAVR